MRWISPIAWQLALVVNLPWKRRDLVQCRCLIITFKSRKLFLVLLRPCTGSHRSPASSFLVTLLFSPKSYIINLVHSLTERILPVCSESFEEKEPDTPGVTCWKRMPRSFSRHMGYPKSAPKDASDPDLNSLLILQCYGLVDRQSDWSKSSWCHALCLSHRWGTCGQQYQSHVPPTKGRTPNPKPQVRELLFRVPAFYMWEPVCNPVWRSNETACGKAPFWIRSTSLHINTMAVRKNSGKTLWRVPMASACHQMANTECCASYNNSPFTVFFHCCSKRNLDVLEAIYVHVLEPVLCKHNSFVATPTCSKTHTARIHRNILSSLSPHSCIFTQVTVSGFCLHVGLCTRLLFLVFLADPFICLMKRGSLKKTSSRRNL